MPPTATASTVHARHQLRLDPVRELDARTVAMSATKSGAPAFTGNGITDYVCGACKAVLCTRMRSGQLRGMVFRCGCGQLGRVPGPG